MASEVKTNGTTAEYSPNKPRKGSNASNGDEKYTKKDQEGDEERVPLKAISDRDGDVEKSVPVASFDEEEEAVANEDQQDGVQVKNGKKKKNKDKDKVMKEKKTSSGKGEGA